MADTVTSNIKGIACALPNFFTPSLKVKNAENHCADDGCRRNAVSIRRQAT